MEGDITPLYNITATNSSPFAGDSSKRSLDDAFDFNTTIISDSNEIITPPNSTIRKPKKQIKRNSDDGKEPLSPIQSSPIAPTAKRQRSEGCPRSNGNLSLDEILKSLERRKENNELDKKPPYSYAILICLAILQSQDGKLTLSQIYHWISSHFTFYKPKDASWQNSIRHNLSLNEAFIKTEKSSDGKGHFWEVKRLSTPKFFKGEVGGFDLIRQRLSNIEQYFQVRLNQDEDDEDDNDEDDEDDLQIRINSHLATPRIKFTDDDDDDDNEENDDTSELTTEKSSPSINMYHSDTDISRSIKVVGSNKDMASSANRNRSSYSVSFADLSKTGMNPNFDPNSAMKRTHTTLGFLPTTENLLQTNSREIFSLADYNNNSSNNIFSSSGQNLLKSPNNLKRYICSFNSSFDELSPRPFRNEHNTSTLLQPFSDSPTKTTERLGQLLPHVPSGASNIESQQLDLLKTPELNRAQSLERTPTRFTATPKDTDSSMLKKWQTPSHLFEDIYSSPIFKAMGNTSKVVATPGGSALLRKFSPSKANTLVNNESMKSKLSCGGLFGVDVYSVWKRATERPTSKRDEDTTKDKLDHPFDSRTTRDH